MMDIKLTPNGISLTTSFETTTTVAEKVAQRLYIRFKTQKGVWFFNTEYGVDYFGSVLGKGKTKLSIDAIVRSEIMKDQYVDSIISFESKIVDRKYSCIFTVRLSRSTTAQFALTDNGIVMVDENGNSLSI
jgi:hypothetical protein